MAFLTDEELDTIAARIFRQRESTLEEEGRKLELNDLTKTVQRVRHTMNTAVDSLPPTAFEPQPDDADGNEVWSAGQIISHICQSQRNVTGMLSDVVDLTLEPQTEDLQVDPSPSMVEARGAIKTATVILRDTLKAIPDDADLTKTSDHERFGSLGVRGLLMLVAIHERDHTRQLRSLA